MLSFHNNPAIKEKYLVSLRKLRSAGGLEQRGCRINGKWCSVNCDIHGLNLYDSEIVLGIPSRLVFIEHRLFELLPRKIAKDFAVNFFEAIPIGKSLDVTRWRFSILLLKENIDQVLLLNISRRLKMQVVQVIRDCLKLHEDAIEIGEWDEDAAYKVLVKIQKVIEMARSATLVTEINGRSAEFKASAGAIVASWLVKEVCISGSEAIEWSVLGMGSATYEHYAEELLRLLREA